MQTCTTLQGLRRSSLGNNCCYEVNLLITFMILRYNVGCVFEHEMHVPKPA